MKAENEKTLSTEQTCTWILFCDRIEIFRNYVDRFLFVVAKIDFKTTSIWKEAGVRDFPQLAFTCSKPPMETSEQCVKSD